MTLSAEIGIWIAAALTLCLYSFLYRDNPFYKFAEHLFVGVAQGYLTARTYFDGFLPYVWRPLMNAVGAGDGPAEPVEFVVIIPIGLGLLFFARFSKGHAWLTRLPLAFIIGTWCGINIPAMLNAQIFQQMNATIAPFGTMATFGETLKVVIVLLGSFAALTYFFFSVEHRGAVGRVSRVGIWFLMIGFGSAFGNTVMNRVMLLIQRVEFLMQDWMGPLIVQRVVGLFG
ncbi:hypothetical protein CMK11_01095 [Candidatus Poribacteria bacterium]|nr:hypothetical protein [Candidatus Poribacteria bacterium]